MCKKPYAHKNIHVLQQKSKAHKNTKTSQWITLFYIFKSRNLLVQDDLSMTFCYLQSLHIPLHWLVKSLKPILCTIYYFNNLWLILFRELTGIVCFCTKIVSVSGYGLPVAFPGEKHHEVSHTPKDSETLKVIAPLHFNRIKYFIEISSRSKIWFGQSLLNQKKQYKN